MYLLRSYVFSLFPLGAGAIPLHFGTFTPKLVITWVERQELSLLDLLSCSFHLPWSCDAQIMSLDVTGPAKQRVFDTSPKFQTII